MKRDKYLGVRIDADEEQRLYKLSGSNDMPTFVTERLFSTSVIHGNSKEYPGWDIIERGRRDRGIRISHPKFGESVLLYPEDAEWGRFNEM